MTGPHLLVPLASVCRMLCFLPTASALREMRKCLLEVSCPFYVLVTGGAMFDITATGNKAPTLNLTQKVIIGSNRTLN